MKVGNSYIPNRVGIRALNLTDTEILGGPIFSSHPVEINKVYLRAWFFSFSDVTAKALKLPTLIRLQGCSSSLKRGGLLPTFIESFSPGKN